MERSLQTALFYSIRYIQEKIEVNRSLDIGIYKSLRVGRRGGFRSDAKFEVNLRGGALVVKLSVVSVGRVVSADAHLVVSRGAGFNIHGESSVGGVGSNDASRFTSKHLTSNTKTKSERDEDERSGAKQIREVMIAKRLSGQADHGRGDKDDHTNRAMKTPHIDSSDDGFTKVARREGAKAVIIGSGANKEFGETKAFEARMNIANRRVAVAIRLAGKVEARTQRWKTRIEDENHEESRQPTRQVELELGKRAVYHGSIATLDGQNVTNSKEDDGNVAPKVVADIENLKEVGVKTSKSSVRVHR